MKTTRSRYYAGPISDNFDGVRFFSPGQPLPDKSLANLLRWRREGGRAKWPDFVPVTPHVPHRGVNRRGSQWLVMQLCWSKWQALTC